MKDIILANKELNEWCGTGGINYYEGIGALGFLFKYAVPKLQEMDCGFVLCDSQGKPPFHTDIYTGYTGGSETIHCHQEGENPALALFWSIFSALGGKE